LTDTKVALILDADTYWELLPFQNSPPRGRHQRLVHLYKSCTKCTLLQSQSRFIHSRPT